MNQTDGEDGSSESESDWEEVLPAVEGNEEVEYIKARMNDSVPENGKGLGRDIATDGKNHNEVESLKIVIPNPNGLLGSMFLPLPRVLHPKQYKVLLTLYIHY